MAASGNHERSIAVPPAPSQASVTIHGQLGYEETFRIRREYYDLARGIIDRLIEAQVPDSPLDPHEATMSLFGMLNWLYRWYDPTRGRSPNVVAHQIATQFLHGLNAIEAETRAG